MRFRVSRPSLRATIKPILAELGEIQDMLPHLPPEEVRRTLNLEVADFEDETLLTAIEDESNPFGIHLWKPGSEKSIMGDVVATIRLSRTGDDEHAIAFDVTPNRIVRREEEYPKREKITEAGDTDEDIEVKLGERAAYAQDRTNEAAALREMTGTDFTSKKTAETLLSAARQYKEQLKTEREYLTTLQAPEREGNA